MTTNEEPSGRRPKRRCAARNIHVADMPSAVHYVGYVEDDETPEMIMAKFVELERIKEAAQAKQQQKTTEDDAANISNLEDNKESTDKDQPSTDNQPEGLTDEQLLEVFKQTSMFNVKTALHDNAMLMGIDEVLEYTAERYGDDDVVSDDDDLLRSFWSDDEDGPGGYNGYYSSDDENRGRRGRNRRGGSRKGTGTGRQRNFAATKARHNIVTAYNPETQALVRRRVRAPDPDEIVQVRVPATPIPLAWGRSVKPWMPKEGTTVAEESAEEAPVSGYVELASMAQLSTKQLPTGTYMAALVNPGWTNAKTSPLERDATVLSNLAKLQLHRIVPTGFIFIWTPKEYVHAVCKQMVKWGYSYIENLTWVYQSKNNSILTLPSEFVRNSHMTLYMFRMADKGKDIELRHQRNPDVAFDCLLKAQGGGNSGCVGNGGAEAPGAAVNAIETLLPNGKGQLLELWATKGVKRSGWTHVVEVPEA